MSRCKSLVYWLWQEVPEPSGDSDWLSHPPRKITASGWPMRIEQPIVHRHRPSAVPPFWPEAWPSVLQLCSHLTTIHQAFILSLLVLYSSISVSIIPFYPRNDLLSVFVCRWRSEVLRVRFRDPLLASGAPPDRITAQPLRTTEKILELITIQIHLTTGHTFHQFSL